MDTQSVRNTDTAEQKGYDAGKKHHLAVDTHSIRVTTAHMTDRSGALTGWSNVLSDGWLEKGRRLWKNVERKLNTHLSFVHRVFLVLLLKKS